MWFSFLTYFKWHQRKILFAIEIPGRFRLNYRRRHDEVACSLELMSFQAFLSAWAFHRRSKPNDQQIASSRFHKLFLMKGRVYEEMSYDPQPFGIV